MRKDPAERPASAQAVIDLLKPWTPRSPLPMGRVKQERSSKPRTEDAVKDGPLVGGPPPSSSGSSAVQESSRGSVRGSNPSTRGLLSENEETDRAGELQPQGEPVPAAAGWGWVLGRSVAVAAVAAIVVVALVRLSFAFDKQQSGTMLSGGALQLIGWATFGLLMAIQLILAAGRERQ